VIPQRRLQLRSDGGLVPRPMISRAPLGAVSLHPLSDLGPVQEQAHQGQGLRVVVAVRQRQEGDVIGEELRDPEDVGQVSGGLKAGGLGFEVWGLDLGSNRFCNHEGMSRLGGGLEAGGFGRLSSKKMGSRC
jgi:hypothetical protein